MTASPPLLFLIGYRGTGKTTVGPLLARRLGWTFLDADERTEATAGMSIADIFAAEGEPGFRDRESATLAELCRLSGHVVATGGGVVLRPANRELLRNSGFVAWLSAPAEAIWDRIRADTTTAARRPNLTVRGGLDEVRTLLAEREPLYRATADFEIATEGLSPDAVADAILSACRTPRSSSAARPSSSSG
ncbi:MAG TPA: shikimate kinase [Gemmataceae bacterium]|nr:shikimate kinase [Gemmataceae bacterium]